MKSWLIVSAIRGLIERGGVRKVHIVNEKQLSGFSGRAAVSRAPRLLVVLRGYRYITCSRQKTLCPETLNAGESIFVAPNCWIATTGGNFLSLGVIFDSTNPRLILTRGAYEFEPPHQQWVVPAEGITTPDMDPLLAGFAEPDPGAFHEDIQHRRADLLLLKVGAIMAGDPVPQWGKARTTFNAALHFLESNLADPLRRESVARELHIHPGHVTRLFIRFTGKPFGQYLQQFRLERARDLLDDPALSISEIAYQCGFAQHSHFCRVFRQRYGSSPGEYRRKTLL